MRRSTGIDTKPMKSLEKTIEILELLKDSSRRHSIAELSARTGQPPSTVHRILSVLCEHRYAVRDEAAHTYQLGPALIPLGRAAAEGFHLQDVARPVLRTLSARLYEDSYLIIKVGDKGMVLLQQSGTNHLKVVEEFGYEMDLHCGAIRKVLLAYQPKEYIQYYLDNQLDRPNAFPRTSRTVLEKELKQIRRDGISVSYGEYVHEAAGIGAPVFGHDGSITAAIGIIVPLSRIHDEKRMSMIRNTVQDCAQELSVSLGSV